MKFFMGLTLVLAIVTAGISPACAFIGGKTSLIELCSPNGDIRKVEVPADMDPFADHAPQKKDHHALDNLDDCTFCFAQSHAKSMNNAEFILPKFVSPAYLLVSAGTSIPQSLGVLPFQPRAPPAFS